MNVSQMDYEKFKKEYAEYETYMNEFRFTNPELTDDSTVSNSDEVNRPSHYTQGKVEAIEIIEDAISPAASVEKGFLQGQALKYLLRMWLKNNPLQDARKAQWYLSRLIESMR